PRIKAEIVSAVRREMWDLDKDMEELLEPFQIGLFYPSLDDQSVACTFPANPLSMRWNERCLLAYHRTRTDKLKEFAWNGVDVVDISGQQAR
ncbi:hypothetical protein IWW34DRAFT_561971, partial [Fusarium oxysporum f. sp. albedinis]